MGFSGGYGRVSGINILEEDLYHPLGFSNKCNSFMSGKQSVSCRNFTKNSFLNELTKTLEMGKAMGYNMDSCFDRLKE